MDKNTIGLATLGATQGIVLFTTLLPDRTQLYQAKPHPAIRQNTRQGECVAALLTMGFSGLLAMLTGDSSPILIGGITTLTMIAAYEYTLYASPIGAS